MPKTLACPSCSSVMFSITKERVFVVALIAYMLWSWGASPPHVAAAVCGLVIFWWLAGPRPLTSSGSRRGRCALETRV